MAIALPLNCGSLMIMAYNPGDLRLLDPPCPTMEKDGFCDEDHVHLIADSRGDYANRGSPRAYLPHSWDEWVIGGPKEIEALIADLQEALKQMKR